MRLGHKYKILTERFDVPTRRKFVKREYRIFGGNGEEETPVPIPNTAVKLFSADGTAREAEWESRSLPKIPLQLKCPWSKKTVGIFFIYTLLKIYYYGNPKFATLMIVLPKLLNMINIS